MHPPALEIGILLPNNQRQHRTVHIQKDVLPYALCQLLCPVSVALASNFQMESISTFFPSALHTASSGNAQKHQNVY